MPKALRPLPSYKDKGCQDLRKMTPPPGQRYIQIHNLCAGETVWPGMIGAGGGAVPPPKGGWQLDPGACKTITVPSRFPSIRIWGRTGCNNATTPGEFKCQTGACCVACIYMYERFGPDRVSNLCQKLDPPSQKSRIHTIDWRLDPTHLDDPTKTGNCVVNGELACTSAASVATLYEATLQGACPKAGQQLAGSGPDFYDREFLLY